MKNIRSKYVKNSLLDYETLAQSLQENTSDAVRALLSEAVRDTYNKILSESEEDSDFDEEEVDDTSSDITSVVSNDTLDSEESEPENGETEESTEEVTPDGAVEKTTVGSDDEGNEWSEFEKYKVSDDKYDFSNAEDDEIVRAYKLMKDDDQLIVTKDGEMVHLQDNETGADYLIDLGQVPEEDDVEDETDGDFEEDYEDEANDEFEDENNTMNEERIFEIALNEYDSHVGYTDNYQKKDVMTNPGMSEPAKSSSTNDWDAGVPKGTEKPWAKKGSDAPFDAGKGKTIEEEVDECGSVCEEDEEMALQELKSNAEHSANKRSTSRTDDMNNPSRKDVANNRRSRHTAEDGQVSGTATESIIKKANAIYEENIQLKKALKEFRNTLNEAAVTNVNLGKIIKLISENTTTMDEKQEIISRFGKEAKTVEQANVLYESISNDLKKKGKMNINEDKQFTANSSKMINETQIYKSKDLMESLGMMHRLCKL